MQRSFSQLTQSPHLYLALGIFFTGAVIAQVYGNVPSFDYRAIGIAIFHGQDISVRDKIHVFAALGGICYFLSLFLSRRTGSESHTSIPGHTHHGAVLSLIVALNFFLFVYTDNRVFLNTLYALLYLAGLAVYVYRRPIDKFSSDVSWIIVALSYQVLITAYCIAGKAPRFDLTFFSILTVLIAVMFTIANKMPEKALLLERRVVLSSCLWPLMLLPLSVLVANEVQYSLSTRFQLHVSGIWIWLAELLSLLLITLGIYLRNRKKILSSESAENSARQITRLLHIRYLPLILISSAAFTNYLTDFDFFRLRDVFHGGESIVPMQQMLEYGSLPYIDFHPTHGLFDFFPQLLYQVINQTHYVESHVWGDGYLFGWLPRLLTALAMYFFLGKYLGYKAAFLTLFALPTYHLIYPYYIPLLLPAMLIGSQKKSLQQWILFWSLLVTVTLWRVDFGFAIACASLFVLIMWAWSERSWVMLARGVSGLALTGLATVFLFSILCVVKGHSPLDVFHQIMNYIVIISPVMSYEKFLGPLNSAVFVQYLFFPLIGVVYAAYFSSRVIRQQTITNLHLVLAYLSVVSLVISVRSLHRHSHYEGVFSTYCFFLVLTLMPLLLPKITKNLQIALVLLICVSGYAFLPTSKSWFQIIYYNTHDIEMNYPAPASNRAPLLLSEAAIPDNRLGPTGSNLDNIVFFLNHFLQGDQTFYDFTNSPLLYALAHKKVPSYTFQTVIHTSEAIQHSVLADLDALYQRGDLPVVLFKQNLDIADSVDGAENEVRSYRVAEYIYKQYTPCVSIDNYEIWLSKASVGTQNCADYLRQAWRKYKSVPGSSEIHPIPLVPSTQFFKLLKLPYVWANYDQLDPLKTASSEQELNTKSMEQSSRWFELQLPESIRIDTGNYIHLRISSEEDTTAELRYAKGNGFSFSIIGDSQPQDYLFRISSQYAWHQQPVRLMRLRTNARVDLEYAGLLPGD